MLGYTEQLSGFMWQKKGGESLLLCWWIIVVKVVVVMTDAFALLYYNVSPLKEETGAFRIPKNGALAVWPA